MYCNQVFNFADLCFIYSSVYEICFDIFLIIKMFTENSDTRFFEIDRSSGHVLVKRTIPDDELLQPATLVVKVSQDMSYHFFIDLLRLITTSVL